MCKVFAVLLAVLYLATHVHGQTFGCSNAALTDQARQMFYNLHNDARLSMAKGLEPNKCGRLTTGSNVYKLNWDCDMEQKAQDWASTCPSSFQTIDSSWGQNFVTYTGTISDKIGTAASAVNNWWSSIRANGMADPDNKYTNSALFQWANMAFGKTTAFACTYNACATGSKFVVTCFYNKIGYATNAVVYQKGPACAADADCTTYPGSTCSGGLCSVVPTGPVVETFNMCPGQTKLSDQARTKFLENHNMLRSRLATGNEPDGISAGAKAPIPKQMQKMVYDCSIEANAQPWAENCVWQHSTPAQRPGLGENLYQTSALNFDKIQTGEDASLAWWSELAEFGVGPEVNLTQEVFNRGVGHYTQMAWEGTYKLGCAVQWCASMTFTVCQYGPAGNMLNSLIYTPGPACTSNAGCPSPQTCSVSEKLCNHV